MFISIRDALLRERDREREKNNDNNKLLCNELSEESVIIHSDVFSAIKMSSTVNLSFKSLVPLCNFSFFNQLGSVPIFFFSFFFLVDREGMRDAVIACDKKENYKIQREREKGEKGALI